MLRQTAHSVAIMEYIPGMFTIGIMDHAMIVEDRSIAERVHAIQGTAGHIVQMRVTPEAMR
jgi:hypothetical protein